MTGRWVASLPDPDDAESRWWATGASDLTVAAAWLATALDEDDEPEACGRAAALIRRHRKNLDTYSDRAADECDSVLDSALLWRALYHVCCATQPTSLWHHADQCRQAEAALRTLWKRQQGRTS